VNWSGSGGSESGLLLKNNNTMDEPKQPGIFLTIQEGEVFKKY
jgi:hypothetical protein